MRTVLLCLAAAFPVIAAEIDFKEQFADPETRPASLGKLVPGTRDWYFYRALDHQLNGRDKEFREVMEAWKAASGAKDARVEAKGYATLENRGLILSYPKDPEKSVAALVEKLNLQLDETHPGASADEKLPDRITPEMISPAAFEAAAARRNDGLAWKGYDSERLFQELDKLSPSTKEERQDLLKKIERADHPLMVDLLTTYYEDTPSAPIDFGHLGVEKKLTLAQKAELLKRVPRLGTNPTFVLSYISQLQSGDETPFTYDRQAQAGYAARIVEFTRTLPPALGSIKVQSLYHHLRLQRELGNFPQDDFLAYLAVPRKNHEFLRREKDGLEDDVLTAGGFSDATGFPRIQGDEPLLRAYLDHLLVDADSAAAFAPFIPDKVLSVFFAEARLQKGEDPARWGQALDPTAFRDLQNATTIAFSPGQPLLLGADDEVKLSVDLKNTAELLVRVFPINLPGYLANHGAEPDVTINLDGLVPDRETKMSFTQPPLVRHRETLDFPDLKGRGAWVVETVSRGVVARALIRKGHLVPYVEHAAGGVTLRVFDEAGGLVPDAAVTLGDQRFTAENGVVRISGNIREITRQSVVSGGGIATLVELDLGPAAPKLEAHFNLDREQVIANEKAVLRLSMRLTDHGATLPLAELKGLTLTLAATQRGGQKIERVISEGLKTEAEQDVEFLVPADAENLSFSLSARVSPSTGGDAILALAEKQFTYLSGDDEKAQIAGAHFSYTTQGHRLDLRGRNGEPLTGRVLHLKVLRDGYEEPVELRIRTGQDGRIELGALEQVTEISIAGTDLEETFYEPGDQTLFSASPSQTVAAGETVRIPLETPPATLDRKRFGLLKLIGGNPTLDLFDKLALEEGCLVIKNLAPGQYELRDKFTFDLIISAGREQDGLLVSADRILPRRVLPNPRVARAELREGSLVIQLDHFTPDTRVDLRGTRYLYDDNLLDAFRPIERPTVATRQTPSSYLTERLLDGEMRYILDRRNFKAFPGSLLPRPGLLVNRWSESEARQEGQFGGVGSGGAPSSNPALERSVKPGSPDAEKKIPAHFSGDAPIDFLATPSTLLHGLKPDRNGMITVPLKDFGTSQSICITVLDQGFSWYRAVPLPPSDPSLRDLRLNRPLDSRKHHVGLRGNTFLMKDATVTIDNSLDARWRAFTTLQDAWAQLAAGYQSETLRRFAFLTNWPALSEFEKLEKLSEHASHELHLFLYRKDRPFFDAYVKPQLLEKKEPQFIDDYLLERDLNPYLRPFAWNNLNAAEKALLAGAIPNAADRIRMDLQQRWEKEAPDADDENFLFASTLDAQGLSLEDSLGIASNLSNPEENSLTQAVTARLRKIILPSVDFKNTTVDEAVRFFMKSIEADDGPDPQRKGISFVVRKMGSGSGAVDALSDPGSLVIPELRLRNVPVSVALKYMCDATRLRYKVTEYAVVLSSQTESREDLFTKTFLVPPDFANALEGEEDPSDPFRDETSANQHKSKPKRPIIELLKQTGVTFSEGASATLSINGTLIVTNTPTELDKIESLTMVFRSGSGNPAPSAEKPGGFTDKEEYSEPAELPNSVGAADPFASSDGASAAKLKARRPILLLSDPNQTRIWRESNYYRKAVETPNASLIRLSRFWLDLAAWDGKGPFVSPNFNACVSSDNDALMALAMLDLPFTAEKPQVKVEGAKLTVKAREPMVLFYKDTRETAKVAQDAPLLVRQTIQRFDDPVHTEGGRKVENNLTGDLVAGVPYLLHHVISNPTGNEIRADMLAQIPAGSIALLDSAVTLSETLSLDPNEVKTVTMAFYFPEVGKFPLYPFHVSEGDTVLAHTATRECRVVAKAPAENATSWPVIAREGTNEAVLERLLHGNLHGMDLGAIRWRLEDRAFYLAAVSILRDRLFFSPEISCYGFRHRDTASIREYLENSEAITQLGGWLDTPLLAIRPSEHLSDELLEFDPLVNPRAHRLSDQARITHPDASDRYEQVLDLLSWKPSLSDQDQLTLTLWLQLQDRTEEALARFAKIDPANLGSGHMAYDYLNAVLLFAREKPAEAKAIALKYVDHPLALWHDRFAKVVSQADEITGLATPRSENTPSTDTAPLLEIAEADGSLLLRQRNLKRTTLQLFHVDLEVLFSKDPFLSGGGASLPAIRANETREIAFTGTAGETKVELPEAFRQGNVLVAADTGTSRVLQVIDSRAIEIVRTPLEKLVQALDTTGKPLPKTYVKVYVETRDGSVKFHKDGYTDLRGKFDYLSHTGEAPADLKRIAVLFVHPTAGAKTLVFEP